MITTILFDLDGTLLPMDLGSFIENYLSRMAAFLAPHGYNSRQLVQTIWDCTDAMAQNTGSKTNEQVFWEHFARVFGPDVYQDKPLYEQYYHTDFQLARSACGFDPRAGETIRELKAMGFRIALATNPMFPAIATQSRIRWAGIDPVDFQLITTYENSRRCKPNLSYYQEVLDALGANAEECLMVGNDVDEDMIARKLGMQVFLLADCLINRHGMDIEQFPHGSFPELLEFIRRL